MEGASAGSAKEGLLETDLDASGDGLEAGRQLLRNGCM